MKYKLSIGSSVSLKFVSFMIDNCYWLFSLFWNISFVVKSIINILFNFSVIIGRASLLKSYCLVVCG